MLIDDNYRECVCFLCTDDGKKKVERATGFLISFPLDTDNSTDYLITARHVIDESRAEGHDLFAKINLVGGDVRYVPVPQDAWVSHSSTDIAAIPFSRQSGDRYLGIWLKTLADEAYLKWSCVNPGDDIFFIGLFTGYAGENQAEPIVRRGHIALGLKKIQITPNSASLPMKVDAYLAETKSWGGESGSPVFHCKWPNSPTVPISASSPRLIGLLHGHFDIEAESADQMTVSLNSGIGVIIPAQEISQLLQYPDFLDQRELRMKKITEDIKTPIPD